MVKTGSSKKNSDWRKEIASESIQKFIRSAADSDVLVSRERQQWTWIDRQKTGIDRQKIGAHGTGKRLDHHSNGNPLLHRETPVWIRNGA
ncbi:MAG: hypothetical protein AAF850_09705 [Pseudomonadota bacterium]